MSAEENCADIVGPATEAELANAITGNMSNLLAVMKAVKRFKRLLSQKRPHLMDGIFGRESKLVAPPNSIRSGSQKNDDRIPLNRVLVTEGVHQDPQVDAGFSHNLDRTATISKGASPPPPALLPRSHDREANETAAHYKQREETFHHQPFNDATPSSPDNHPPPLKHSSRSNTFPLAFDHAKGHAHDPLLDTLFLDVGAGNPGITNDEGDGDTDQHIVSESPPGVDDNIYELAYQEEMKRILATRGQDASMFLNRRVEHREDLREHVGIVDQPPSGGVQDAASQFASRNPPKSSGGGLAGLIKRAQARHQSLGGSKDVPTQGV